MADKQSKKLEKSLSGNLIVDEISKMHINSIPEAWYQTIKRNGYPHAMAILILWDLIYWYKWTEVRSEATGMVVGYKKKFRADLLQRDYNAIAAKFGISKSQAQKIIVFLEELGVLKRVERTIKIQDRSVPHVMFIELVPAKIKEISDVSKIIPNKDDSSEEDTSIPMEDDLPTPAGSTSLSVEDDPAQICSTNTNNSTTNSTAISTLPEDSSLHSESSCGESQETQGNETQEITDPLKINQKDSEAEDETEYQKETGMNSDSQYLPDDGPCPWEKPANKSKPKIPLPFDVESITLKDGREWKPDGYFLQEMIRLHPQVDVKAEFMAMRGWCMSNPTKRKTWGGIKRFVSGWLDRAQDKPKGAGYSGRPQKYKEAFVDGKRDYSDTDW